MRTYTQIFECEDQNVRDLRDCDRLVDKDVVHETLHVQDCLPV